MEETSAGTPERPFVRPRRLYRQTCIFTEVRPGLVARVDILELEPALSEEVREWECCGSLAERAQLFDLGTPPGWHGPADAREDDVTCDAVELHVAACR